MFTVAVFYLSRDLSEYCFIYLFFFGVFLLHFLHFSWSLLPPRYFYFMLLAFIFHVRGTV